ncbi:MAG: winged helix-turn-helix transcriptional regulator [Candidatus Methanoplasma sp.]|nr:winged helix-turn-helix transcriptional regulator [Candidatus Methanoplasma sp.]
MALTADLSPKASAVGRSASEVLDALKSDGSATMAALAETTGVSEKTVSRVLSELKAAGIIVRVGSRRGGRWEIR